MTENYFKPQKRHRNEREKEIIVVPREIIVAALIFILILKGST